MVLSHWAILPVLGEKCLSGSRACHMYNAGLGRPLRQIQESQASEYSAEVTKVVPEVYLSRIPGDQLLYRLDVVHKVTRQYGR